LSSFSPIQTNYFSARRPFVGWLIVIALVTLAIATSGAMAQNGVRFPRRLSKLPSIGRSQPPHPAVVRVQANDDRGSSHGSGTLVDVQGDYALVVTNWHVVRDAPQRVSVTFPNGFHTAARVIRMDKDWDLAALVVWNPGNVTPVAIADRAPQLGDALTIAGYGSGNYRAVSGRCTQYVAPGIDFPYEMVEVSVQARQGDSGGPIFNEQSELAGVLFGAAPGTTSGSYAGRVQQFLLTAWPDFGVPRDTIIAATPADPRRTSGCLTSIDCVPESGKKKVKHPVVPVERAPRSEWPSAAATSVPQQAHVRMDRETGQEIAWEDLVGHSPIQQAKTLFALIGVVVILLHLINFSPD